MSPDSSDEPILVPILAIVVVTALLLVGVRSWLGPRHPDAPVGDPEIQQSAGPPRSFVFRPEPGRYVQEIRSSTGEQLLVAFDIEHSGGGIRISRPWTPPEPCLLGAPPELRDRMQHIRVLVEVGPQGHVQDVTGPDDYFDRLDTTDPDLADRLRAMKLEEQLDAFLGWQLTALMTQPTQEGSRFSSAASAPGLGDTPGWLGTIDYEVQAETACPSASGESRCIPVVLKSRAVSEAEDSLEATLWLGAETGLEWKARLRRTSGSRSREVTRRTYLAQDSPWPLPGAP